MQDTRRHGAKQRPLQRTPAMRADHQEPRVEPLGREADLLDGKAAEHANPRLDTLLLGPSGCAERNRVGAVLAELVEIGRDWDGGEPDRRRGNAPDTGHDELRLEQLRKLDGCIRPFLRGRRAVGGKQDGFHDSSFHGRKTMRAGTSPASTSSIARSISSSGRSFRITRVLPAAWSSNPSRRSSRVPTIEPTTVMPFSTVSKIGSSIVFSAGSATSDIVPPRRSEAKACSNAFGATARTTAASAPPSFLIAATGSSSAALTVNSAPSSRATASFSSNRSTATTLAPAIRAYCMAR